MNFVSKFDGSLSSSGTHPNVQTHVESVTTKAPADAIIVQDAQLLFTGDFKRSGSDLVISKGEHELRVTDYFKGDKHAPLASPDGAYLTGKIVDALTGHVQVAQADGSAGAIKIIGHVTKLTGSATVVRNGVSIVLNNGDNVHQGDVVQTGSGSTLGITFIDGSVFGLASNAKMVLNEMVYDPNGANNSSLMSLVSGTISFVAGATAKHGDMKVDTPVATMGIRGTAVLVEIEFDLSQVQPTLPNVIGSLAPPVKFQVLVEPDGTTGSYVLLDRVTLAPLATVNQAGTVTTVSGTGVVSFLASAQLSPEVIKLISEVFSQKYTDNSNPKSDTHFTDSPIPDVTFGFKFANGDPGVGVIHIASSTEASGSQTSTTPPPNSHIPGKPSVFTTPGTISELTLQTGSSLIDQTDGIIRYADVNAGDIPTARTTFESAAYKDAQGNDVTLTLTAAQKAAIANVSVPLIVVQDPAHKNYGTATWTYKIPDGAADFLAEGETLTLTYRAFVDNNFAPANETGEQTFTVTITGTNDAPTIVVGQTIAAGGVQEDSDVLPSGNIETGGTITFKDVDLTDTHTASFVLKSTDATANLPGFAEGTGAGAAHIGTFALTAISEVPADGNDNGSLGWTFTLADNDPVLQSLAQGQTITQVYTVTISDGHAEGGTVTRDVIVTITGTNDGPTIVGAATTTAGTVIEDTNVSGGHIAADGTITFQDLDLIDTHTATVAFTSSSSSAHLPGFTEGSTHIGTLTLDPAVTENNADTGNIGSVGWHFSLDDSDPVLQSLADGQTITQVYTVTVTDNNGAPVTQTVTVTIAGTNDAPTIEVAATIATGEVIEDTDVSGGHIAADGTITFQDLDLIDTHTATVAFASSSSSAHLPGFIEGSTHIGTLTLDPAVTESNADTSNIGSVGWHFSLDDSDPVLQSLADGQTITQVYTVTITDNNGVPVTQDVTVTIAGTNDAPTIEVAATGAAGEVTEDTDVDALNNIAADGTITFQDLDLIDTHTATSVFKSSSSNAHLPGFIDGSTHIGTFTLDPAVTEDNTDTNNIGSVGWHFTLDDDDPVLQSLAYGETITQVYTITVTDNNGVPVTQDVTITITGSNDGPNSAPTIVAELTVATGIVNEDELVDLSNQISADGTIAFQDLDLIDTHTATAAFKSSSSNTHLPGFTEGSTHIGNFVLDPAVTEDNTDTSSIGSVGWHFTLDDSNPILQSLAEGQTITQVYTVTVTDNNHVSVTQDVTVTIAGTNDAPTVASSTSDTPTLTEDSVAPDESLTAGGTITFQDIDLIDTHTATFELKSSTSSAHLPGFADDTPLGTFALSAATVDALTHAVTENSADQTNTAAVDWTFTLADDNPILQSLAEGQTITQVYTVTITDNTGAPVTQDVTITLAGTNDAPTVASSTNDTPTLTEDAVAPDESLTAGGTITFQDIDLIDTHTATFALKSSTSTAHLPGFADDTPLGTFALSAATVDALTHTVTENSADQINTAAVDWTFTLADDNPILQSLAEGQTITQVYTVTITDNNGVPVTQDITITIMGANDAPALVTAGTTGEVTEDTDVDVSNNVATGGNIDFQDVDLTDLHAASYVLKSSDAGPDLPGFSEGTGAGAAHIGTFALAVTEDNTDGIDTGSVGWTFTLDNSDPVLQSLAEGQTITQVYTVTVPDSHTGGSFTQDVTVTIHGQNDAPHAANVALASGPSGDGWVFDPDNGHYYRYVANSENFAGATSAAAGDGAYLATITSAAENAFIANLPGMSSVPYGVWTGGVTSDANPDGNPDDPSHWSWTGGPESGVPFSYTNWNAGEPNGGFSSTGAAMQIGADGTWNDVPTTPIWQTGYIEEWGGRPGDPVTEDQTRDFATATLLAQATDVDTTDVLTVSAVSATSADGAAVTLSGNSITYDPTHAASLQALAAGETATDTFTYTVSDGHTTSTATASVNVVGLNDTPVFVAAGEQSLVNHLTGISVPVNSQDGQSHPYDDNVWSVTGPAGQLNDASGIGYLINPSLGNDFSTPLYSLHGHTYIAPYEPDPSKYVITFQFDTPTVVTDLDVIEHYNGVTILHGYAGNSLGSLTDVGSSVGSLGDLTGQDAFHNGDLNEFHFNNSISGTYFQVVVEKTSLDNGFAFFRMIPETTGSVDSASFTEGANATDAASGALLFTDVDASDMHSFTVTGVTPSGATSGLPDTDTLKGWLSLGAMTDSTNGATGSQEWSFSVADGNFDYLAAEEQVTLTYAVEMSDGHGGTATHDVTVIVTGTNDAPVFTGAGLSSDWQSNTGPVSIVGNVVAADVDSDNYDGGSLTATVTAGGHQGDTLTIQHNQYIDLSGTTVMYDADGDGLGAVAIGTLTNNGINTLTITLNGDADDAAVAKLTEAVQFSNSTAAPATGERTVTFTLRDGGGTAGGGHDSANFDATVAITNTPPTASNVTASGNEDATSIVVDFAGTDAEGVLATIKIETLPSHGNLYSDAALTQLLDVGDEIPVAAVGPTSAYFVPDADWSGSVQFSYFTIDDGGLQSLSAGTATINVSAVADPPTLAGDFTPIASGDEFQVNTTTANAQTYSAVGALEDGGFVIAWVSAGQDGSGTGIYAQRYDGSGAPVGDEFRVNTATADDQSSPFVQGLANGGYVIAWVSGNNNGATIHAQQYSDTGATVGNQIDFSGYGENPSVAALANGGYVVTYISTDASLSGSYAVIFDASGNATNGPLLVNTTTASYQQPASVAGTPDGNFIVAWNSYGQDGDSWGVYFQRVDASGNKLGGETLVNETVAGTQYGGKVAVLTDGSFVVTWQDQASGTVVARHFDASGQALSDEVVIGTGTDDTVQALPDGGYMVTYMAADAVGSSGLFGQRVSASDTLSGDAFQINQTTAGDQSFISDRSFPTAVLSSGTIVSTWYGEPNTDGSEIHARLFTVPGIGEQGTEILLPTLAAALTDTDGSETLVLKLSGFPAGSTFSLGAAGTGADAGKWIISGSDVALLATTALTANPPANFHGDFTLAIAAVSTEPNGSSATSSLSVDVHVAPTPGNHGPIPENFGWITRVSVSSGDEEGDGDSFAGAVGNGGVAVFSSDSENLVDADGNSQNDIYVHRLQDGTTERVNVSSSGDEAFGQTFDGPSISANGNFVVFASLANNLAAGDNNGVADIFLRDVAAHSTIRVSLDDLNAEFPSESMISNHAVSDDGNFVVFETQALGSEHDQNQTWDIYVRDVQAGTTELVSAYNGSYNPGAGASNYGLISGDGQFVVFNSTVDGLDTNAVDDNSHRDVYIRDLANHTTRLVSAADDPDFGDSFAYGISRDGRYVLYTSEVTGSGGTIDLFVRDMQTGNVTQVTEEDQSFFTSADISADGRYVVYSANTGNGDTGVFVYDMNTHISMQVSVDANGNVAEGGSNSEYPAISPDGRFITFDSDASNLVDNDGNVAYDAFVVDLAALARTIHDNTDGQPLATFGLLAFTDQDAGDTHTIDGITPLGAGYVGTFVVEGAPSESGGYGTFAWHYQVDHSDIAYLADGQSVTQSYLVKIGDGTGFTYEQVDITLVGSNDAPVASPDAFTLQSNDISLASNVLSNDIDVDNATLSVSGVAGATFVGGQYVIEGIYGELTVDADGSFSYVVGRQLDQGDPVHAAQAAAYDALAEGSTAEDVFNYTATDGLATSSSTLTLTVTAPAPPSFVQLAGEAFLGGAGEQAATDVSYANGHLYLTYNALPIIQAASDHSTVVSFSTYADSTPVQDFSYAWSKGFFNGVAADGSNIYAVGASHPGAGLTNDLIGGAEDKTLLATFNADGTAGSSPVPATDYAASKFFPGYDGVEIFQDVLVTTQGGNTVLYAVGHGQPPTANGGYVIASYDSNNNLLHAATDPASGGFSVARDVVEFNGQIWAVGYTEHAGPIGRPAVWSANYDLSSVTMHADTTGSAPGDFFGAAADSSGLYAVGYVTSNGNDNLITKYNTDGSVIWSSTFGGAGSEMLTSAVMLNGHLYVVGTTADSYGHTDGVLMEIDTTNGTILSTTTYGGELDDAFNSITTDGHYLYVAGETKSFGSGGSGEDKAILLTYDVGSGPEIDTDHFQVSAAGSNTPTTVTGLSVSDSNPNETLAYSAVAAEQNTYGSSITPSSGSGDLATVNAAIGSFTYDPGATPPPTDMITFTVTSASGSDTVHFVFDQAANGPGIGLTGTSGKDVIFGTESDDTLTGGAGRDQFVFTATPSGDVQHTVTDFETSIDRIDIRSFDAIDGLSDPDITIAQQGNDTLITLDSHNSILLQNVVATNIHAGNFLFHA